MSAPQGPMMFTASVKMSPTVYVLGLLLPEAAVRIEQSPLTPNKAAIHVFVERMDKRFPIYVYLRDCIFDRFHEIGWSFGKPQPEPFEVDVPVRAFMPLPIQLGPATLAITIELEVTKVVLDVVKAK